MRSAHDTWRRLPALAHARYHPLRRPDSNRLGGERLESRRLLSLSGAGSDDDGLPKDPVPEVLPQIAAIYTAYLPHGVSRSDLAQELSKRADATSGNEAGSAESSSFVSLISVSESEPNNSIATADAVPLGFDAGEDPSVDVSGTVSNPLDDDFYSMSLQPGDVLGALVNGGATNFTLRSPTGSVLVGSAQDASFIYPVSSPLPGGGDAALAWVVDTAGTYTIAVDAGSGAYDLNLRLFRPVLEAEPVLVRQILFLDFDGDTIDTSIFDSSGIATLSPLSSFLGGWGLGAANENAVVDAIVASVAENFGDVAVLGNNGDFENDIVPGHYAIEIRNSRDHADPFGLSNVSRVIVGGTINELGISTIGIAESIDVGNFDTTESAVVLLDLLSADSSDPNSLNQYTLGAGVSIIDLIGVGVGNITAHEAGHFFANFHTNQFNSSANIMDQGGNLDNTIGVGADGIFDNGAGDDVDVDFGDDVFVSNEGFTGTEDTLNSIAFGLSTGTVSTGMIVLRSNPADGDTVFTAPVDFVIDFLDDYDPNSVDAFDLVVANVPADSFTETDSNTLTFHYNSTPVTSQGPVLMELAEGSILRDGNGDLLQAFSATFRYDSPVLAAVTLTPASGATVPIPFTNLRVDFNEDYDPNTAGTDDLALSVGTVANITLVDTDTIDYTLSLPFAEGPLLVTMPDNALDDVFGNAGVGFSASYTLDFGAVPYPLPLVAVAPLGSLIYDPSISGTIDAGDTDQFTISLDAGQSITVTIIPDANLQARVEVFNPNSASAGTVTAAAAGAPVALQAVAASEPGLYTIDLSGAGGTTGQYTLQVILNAVAEDEHFGGGSNDTIGTAQNLVASSIGLVGPADRLAVLGTVEAGGSQVTVHDSTDVPVTIEDLATSVSTLSIGSSGSITDVNVTIDLSHTFDDDLVISLVSPIGTQVFLVINEGGSGNDFTDTVFDDEASSSITSGSPPFTGTFRPEGLLSDFDGEDTAGVWTLVIDDTAGLDVGTLHSWSLTVTAQTAAPDVYAIDLVANQSTTLALTAVAGGSVAFELQDSAGTPLASVASVGTNVDQVISQFAATISDTYYLVVTGSVGATYSLLATRGADFDIESNGETTPQNLDGTVGVLGAIEVLPAVNTTSAFEGLDFSESSGFVPPDTHAAAGLNHVVEVVNSAIAIYLKSSGVRVQYQLLNDFFASVGAVSPFDPVVAYDELADRFIVAALDVDFNAETAALLYAVSNSSDPTAGFDEMHTIDVEDPGAPDDFWGDYPKVGWNADAHVFTLNMFDYVNFGFDHVSVISIDKSTVLDANPGTISAFDVDRDTSHFTMAAATMHGAVAGDPMWFVEEAGYANGADLRVIRMDDVLSSSPTFTDVDVPVDSYGFPPAAEQPGDIMETNDTRVLNAEWRGGRLVASQTVGLGGDAKARWYEFSTTGAAPTLTEQGVIDPGPGVNTYFPAIAIAANGDLGMTYMQSSSSEFVSMYITGQNSAAASTTMLPGVLARAGENTYSDFTGAPYRAGDYAGITVDPATGTSFWAANQYATSAASENWGTFIAGFNLPSGSDDDWYELNLVADTRLGLFTRTPGGGPLEFVNPLDPHIELLDDTGGFITGGVPLADGKNEGISFIVPSDGVYRVRVSAENGSLGEYVLGTGAPVITTSPGTLDYTENDPPSPIDALLLVTDADDTDLEGATVRFTSGYATGEDVLGFSNQAGISGSFDSAAGVLTLTGTASVADYQTALRSVTYENTSGNPSTAGRTVAFQVSDGDSDALAALRDIAVTAADDDVSDVGFVAYWNMNEGSGTLAADTSPSGIDNSGMLKFNAAFTADGLGGAVGLDGFGDYVDIPDSVDINRGIHGQHTVALWFNAANAGLTSRKQVLWEQGGSARGLSIYLHGGLLYVGGWNTIASESNWQGTFLSTPVTSGEWHHVALVLDGGPTLQPNVLSAYLDGAVYASGDGSQVWDHGDDIGIGRIDGQSRFHTGASTGNANGFAGLIDEVRVYGRVLLASEIASLADDLVTLQLTVTVPETTLSENGGVVSATVTRNGDLGSALIVSLSTSDSSAATVPTSVTIAANEASATFDITGVNDSASDGTQSVIITASAGGFNSGTVTLDVLDDDAISDDGLVSYWSFDQGSGTVALDTAPFGTATDGILRGNTTWSTTGLNGSLTFDGDGDFVDVPDSADVNLGIHATHSVSLWFKVTNAAITTRKQVIWEQGGASRGMNIYVYDGQVYVGGWNTIASESNWQGTFLSASVSSGVWHHVALVLNGGPTLQPNSLTAYLDGVQYATGDGSQVWDHGDDIGIGRQDGATRFHDGAATRAIDGFAGLIDEVRVYNRSLTATDVDLLANSVTLTNFGLGLSGLAGADGRTGLADPVSTAPKASDRGAALVAADPNDPRGAIFALHALAASREDRAGEFADSRGDSDFDQILSQLAWHWLYETRHRANGENADHTTF